MRQCKQCGKGSVIRGKRKLLRGHYNPVDSKRKYPNLQYVTIGGVRKMVCVQCMRTLAKSPRVRAPRKAAKKGK
ncbi:MAG: hypothetical protein HY978_02335 [Candidatus Liptonbacteria bacterium]|nr:hypothetical protein [Candidatus Liptonbacteria bacterium]